MADSDNLNTRCSEKDHEFCSTTADGCFYGSSSAYAQVALHWRITHERLSMTSCCIHSALPQSSAALLACYWGFNETQGEHTWLPAMPHGLHFSTTIKCPHFKVTLFQLDGKLHEPAEHDGLCGGLYWPIILAQLNNHCNKETADTLYYTISVFDTVRIKKIWFSIQSRQKKYVSLPLKLRRSEKLK